MQDEFIDHRLESESLSILTPEVLNEIMIEEFPQMRLGPSVSQVLMTLTNGFLQDILQNSYTISKQKNNSEVQADDILVYLKIKYPNTNLEEFCETFSHKKENRSGACTLISEDNAISNNTGLMSIKLFNIERFKSNSKVIFELTSKIRERRISQRLKQIDIAKNSIGYQRYTTAVKKNEREKELYFTWHPTTPDPYSNTSKSCFSGRLKEWKLRLHLWGNLDDLVYNYLIENNLKFPPGTNSNCYNKINYFENILSIGVTNTNDPSFNFVKFSDLRISPISLSEETSFTKALKTNKNQLICSSNSQINSISLSKKILLPKIIDCKKDYDIENHVTLFIPNNYKGILIWKSSNFIRHCDINSATNKYYLKILERGLSLFEFNKRHGIEILRKTQCPEVNYLRSSRAGTAYLRECNNKLCKSRSTPYKEIYHLINSQETIRHRSNKVILTQNKLFGFDEQDVFRLPFSYHPSTFIQCKILDKLTSLVLPVQVSTNNKCKPIPHFR